MLEMMMILLIFFVGSFIQGSSGFGFGLVTIGVLSLFLSLKDSMLIVLALTVILSFRILIKLWKSIILKDLYPILASAMIGRVLAFFIVDHFGEATFMKKVLAFVLIGMVLYLYIKRNANIHPTHKHENRLIPLFAGGLGGVIGGIFAVGGPFFVAYFLNRYHDKRKYIANLQFTFIILNIMTLSIHGANGDLHGSFYLYTASGILVVMLGVTFGMKLFERLPTKVIQNVAYLIILISGLQLLI